MSAWLSVAFVLAIGVLVALLVNPLAWVIPGLFVLMVLIVRILDRLDHRHHWPSR